MMRAVLVMLAIFAAMVLAGTNDLADEQVDARVTAEIMAGAPAWAVTK
jgi:hypothetical protein